jgi:hypothetical protein
VNCVRAGRIECERGDGRDDHGQGLAVPERPEDGKGQEVRARPCSTRAFTTPVLTACSGRPIATAFLELPDKVRVLVLSLPTSLTAAHRRLLRNTTSTSSCPLPWTLSRYGRTSHKSPTTPVRNHRLPRCAPELLSTLTYEQYSSSIAHTAHTATQLPCVATATRPLLT